MRSVLVVALLGSLALASCGGSIEPASSSSSPPPSSPPVLNVPAHTAFRVSAQAIKTLQFQWDAWSEAERYRLFEDADGPGAAQGETPIAELPAAQQGFVLEDISLPLRVNARYRLQACKGSACVDLAQAGIDGIDRGIGYFKASNPAPTDVFGEGLALSADGQMLAVGAPQEDGLNEGIGSTPLRGGEHANVGAVYVFRRGSTGWEQEAYLKPARSLPSAQFGTRVALARHAGGYTLLATSPGDASGGAGVDAPPGATPRRDGSGAVYVFERDAQGQWTQAHFIKPQAPEVGGYFGGSASLSADGQWASVGQPYTAAGGSVLLYRREGSGWVFQQELHSSSTTSYEAFGETLQLDPDGNTLVVGAASEDVSGDADPPGTSATPAAGAVYVFRRDANQHWQQAARLKAPERRANGYFGYPVALSAGGTAIVVGEPGNSNGGATPMEERVHVFRQEGAAWVRETLLTSPLPQAKGGFGSRLALAADGSTLAIANPWEDSRGSGLSAAPVLDAQAQHLETGSVYLYRRAAAGPWSAPVPIKAPNNGRQFKFGWSLALSANGGTLAVHGKDASQASGVGGDPNGSSAYQAGAVYLY